MLFRILGPLEAIDGGAEVDLGPREDRVVLAVLLLERGSVVPTDLLAGAVWGHELPADASIRIADAIGRLRAVLGDDAVLHEHAGGFRLDVPDEDVDRTAFLDAAAAARSALERRDWQEMVTCADAGLALWRGPLLAGIEGLHRARTEGRRLDERRAELREAQITGLLGLGRLDEAVHLAEALRRDD